MNKEQIKAEILNRDRAIKVISKDGMFRAILIKNSKTTRTAQEKHKVHKDVAYYFAQVLTGGSMLAALLKGEERVVLSVEGSGIIRSIVGEALQIGEVRGYLRLKDDEEKQLKFEKVEDVFGAGFMRVTKVLYNKAEPVQGIIPLQYGDIVNDLSYYFFQSEQVPTLIKMDCEFDDEGMIHHSGGIMIQAMPNAKQQDFLAIYKHLEEIESVASFFESGKTPDESLKYLLPFEYDVLGTTPIDFFCRCSKDIFKSKLITLDKSELEDMYKVNHNELVCQYCNNHYYLTEDDFKELIAEKTAVMN